MSELKILTEDEISQHLQVALEMLGEIDMPHETRSTLVFAVSITYFLLHRDPLRLAELAAIVAEQQAQVLAKRTNS